MDRKTVVMASLAVMLLLASMTAISPALATSSQESIVRLNAKGGIPGAPPGKPTPPDEEPETCELFIEVDYLEGHAPNSIVLDYIEGYYGERGITVTFVLDEIKAIELVGISINIDDGISTAEYWAIEDSFNDGIDKAQDGVDTDDDGYDEEFFLKDKWVLYGNTVTDQPEIMGYTLTLVSMRNPKKVDVLAGNYIYIADEGADAWADVHGIDDYGAEAVVLMHELGHSIGIGITEYNRWTGLLEEIYDPDTSSVMSILNEDNAGRIGDWYYSDKYWATRNMKYYTV